nr:MAG TPA: hypothetical protein [Caudoviricetes sp.]
MNVSDALRVHTHAGQIIANTQKYRIFTVMSAEKNLITCTSMNLSNYALTA